MDVGGGCYDGTSGRVIQKLFGLCFKQEVTGWWLQAGAENLAEFELSLGGCLTRLVVRRSSDRTVEQGVQDDCTRGMGVSRCIPVGLLVGALVDRGWRRAGARSWSRREGVEVNTSL